MIQYSLNWMGPINAQWLRENGNHWAAGRIDVFGTDDHYPVEFGVRAMHQSDWNSLSLWLRDFRTEDVWTFADIVEEYEKTNPEIRWWVNSRDDDLLRK